MTQPTHPDFENLERATREIQEVADRINEIKRRKDIVEKIVGDRRRTDVSVSNLCTKASRQCRILTHLSICRWCKFSKANSLDL